MIHSPSQAGPVLAIIGKFSGSSISNTSASLSAVQPLASIITTVYVPLFAVVAFAIPGFCKVDTKPFGPVQSYVYVPEPPDAVALKLMSL